MKPFVVICLLAILLSGRDVTACSCGQGPSPYEKAASVAIVTAISNRALPEQTDFGVLNDSKAIVHRVFKGEPFESVSILSGGISMCTSDVKIGQTYLAFVDDHGVTNLFGCSGTFPISPLMIGSDETETIFIRSSELLKNITQIEKLVIDSDREPVIGGALQKKIVLQVLRRAITRLSRDVKPSLNQLRYLLRAEGEICLLYTSPSPRDS